MSATESSPVKKQQHTNKMFPLATQVEEVAEMLDFGDDDMAKIDRQILQLDVKYAHATNKACSYQSSTGCLLQVRTDWGG